MGRQLHLRLDEHGSDAVDVALVRCELVVSEQSQVGLGVIRLTLHLAASHSKIKCDISLPAVCSANTDYVRRLTISAP